MSLLEELLHRYNSSDSKAIKISPNDLIYILQEIAGLTYLQILSDNKTLNGTIDNSDNKIDSEVKKVIKKIQNGISIDHAIGWKYFYNRKFFVGNNLLAPRHDSEVLIEEILDLYKNHRGSGSLNSNSNTSDSSSNTNHTGIDILEIGIGTGCLFITLINEFCKGFIKTVTAVDINTEAIEISKKNNNAI